MKRHPFLFPLTHPLLARRKRRARRGWVSGKRKTEWLVAE